MYNNNGLVRHAEKALSDKTKYMWGGIYRPITENYIQRLRSIYGSRQYPESRVAELRKCIGKGYYGIDCVGLIKSYYWSGNENGGRGSKNYGKAGFPDVNANMMFAAARKKGTIDTLPETPGVILYSKTNPHVGVYAGGGMVIESTLGKRGDGVVKTRVADWSGWTHWFCCPYIEYESGEGKPTAPKEEGTAPKKGDKVKIKSSALFYSGSKIRIPDFCKGRAYTVQKVNGDRLLLKEIYSWISVSDTESVTE